MSQAKHSYCRWYIGNENIHKPSLLYNGIFIILKVFIWPLSSVKCIHFSKVKLFGKTFLTNLKLKKFLRCVCLPYAFQSYNSLGTMSHSGYAIHSSPMMQPCLPLQPMTATDDWWLNIKGGMNDLGWWSGCFAWQDWCCALIKIHGQLYQDKPLKISEW